MVALLGCLSFVMGPVQILKLYVAPYWVCLIFFMLDLYFYEFETKFLLFSFFDCMVFPLNLRLNADFCHVVGLGHLLASSWPRGQTSMVSWKGNEWHWIFFFISFLLVPKHLS